jgi:hypothetical protein
MATKTKAPAKAVEETTAQPFSRQLAAYAKLTAIVTSAVQEALADGVEGDKIEAMIMSVSCMVNGESIDVDR